MGFVLDEIEFVGGDDERGAKAETLNPIFIEMVQLLQVINGDTLLVISPPMVDPL